MKPQLVSRDIKYNQSKPISSMNAHPVCMRQSISNQLAMEKQSHAVQTGRTVTTHVLKKKKVQARAEGHRAHLRSGSPCLHTGSCWKSGHWAKGGKKGQKRSN